jgi:hypothetical protein
MSPATWWRLVRDDSARFGGKILDGDEPFGYLDAEQEDAQASLAVMVFAVELFSDHV